VDDEERRTIFLDASVQGDGEQRRPLQNLGFSFNNTGAKGETKAMSSDLTFITNEQGRSLADRFSALLGDNTRAFDCLVGYFYLSGFRRLSDALTSTETIRVLIGLATDRPTFELLSHADDSLRLELRSHAEAKEALGCPTTPDETPIDSMRCNHPQPPRNLRGFLMMRRSTLSSLD
jgi:hypothetical protein